MRAASWTLGRRRIRISEHVPQDVQKTLGKGRDHENIKETLGPELDLPPALG